MPAAVQHVNGHGPDPVPNSKAPKLSKNQQKRQRKKVKKIEDRASREASVVTESESEAENVSKLHFSCPSALPYLYHETDLPRLQVTSRVEPLKPAPSSTLDLQPEDAPDLPFSDLDISEDDPSFAEFKRIFDHFNAHDVSVICPVVLFAYKPESSLIHSSLMRSRKRRKERYSTMTTWIFQMRKRNRELPRCPKRQGRRRTNSPLQSLKR